MRYLFFALGVLLGAVGMLMVMRGNPDYASMVWGGGILAGMTLVKILDGMNP